jgi:hypothetical protein
MDGSELRTFDVTQVDDLTVAAARDLEESGATDRLVRYGRSSPEARTILRGLGIPFVGADGEVYLHEPPIHVELAGKRVRTPPTRRPAAFARKASRVSRWLLLNPGTEPTLRALSEFVELSESVVSRTVGALADDRLVEVEADRSDARARRVRVRDGGALLDSFERATRREPRSSTWDVGARDVDTALRRVRMGAKRGGIAYAIGSLAGASLLRPVVEPVEAEVWVGPDDYDRWLDQLTPISSRRGAGRVTINLMSDPFVLSLAWRKQGLMVADPVQLYCDCCRSGERALEAAQAVRGEMGW